MLIASGALAQEVKTAKPDAVLSGSAANAPSREAAVNVQAPASIPTAQENQEETVAADQELGYEPLQVGDATQGLLAWQRSGELSSVTPRPIAGAVANLSYQRYLKSFEFPIPERMTSSVKSSSGGSGK